MANGRRTAMRQHVRRALRPAWFGALRRTTPISDRWGYDRGNPVDRYYIERFIEANRADIRGEVLEVKEPEYAEAYGTGVARIDVIDKAPGNPLATIVADLAAADGVPSAQFDCCIVTQTLQFIYDVHAAVRELHRILKPGGVLLATLPVITRQDTSGSLTDCWRLTPATCTRLFGDVFGPTQLVVEGHGNVLAAIAFLEGMAHEELTSAELAYNDPSYHIVVTVRAVKQVDR